MSYQPEFNPNYIPRATSASTQTLYADVAAEYDIAHLAARDVAAQAARQAAVHTAGPSGPSPAVPGPSARPAMPPLDLADQSAGALAQATSQVMQNAVQQAQLQHQRFQQRLAAYYDQHVVEVPMPGAAASATTPPNADVVDVVAREVKP